MSTNREDRAHALRGGGLQLLYGLGQVLGAGVQLTVSRLYGAATYGLYMTSVGLFDVLQRAGTAGADKAMLRYVAAHRAAGERELERRALATGVRLGAITAALLAVALFFAAPALGRLEHKSDLAPFVRLTAPLVLTAVVVRILVEAMLAARAVRMNLYVRGLFEPALLFALVLGGAALGGGATRLGLACVLGGGATCLLAWAAARRVFGRSLVAARAHPTLIGFSLPAGGAELCNAVFQRADLLVLSLYATHEEVGRFAAAEFLCSIIAATRIAFDSLACGVLSEALHTGDRERLRYNLTLFVRLVALLSGFAFATLIVLRRELLALYGAGFVAAAGAFVLLAVKHLINASLGLTPWVLMMGGRSRLMLCNNVGAAALAVVLSLLFIPRFGLMGAAAAGLASEAALEAAYLVETWWLERVHPFSGVLLRVAAAVAVTAAAQAALRGAVPHTLVIPTVALGGALVYGATLLLLGVRR
jgi:O-antigen/teichoic acid export membrane protein